MTVTTLLGRTIKALGAKNVAAMWGFKLGYVYALARDPADPEHPDNTGTERDPHVRVVDLLEKLSTYPAHRPLLLEWELAFRALFDRLLGRAADPACDATLIQHASDVAREAGEAVAATLQQALEQGDHAAALQEVLEAKDRLDGLAAALRRSMDTGRGPAPTRVRAVR